MPASLLSHLEQAGNVTRVRDLIAAGYSATAISRAVASGSIARVCNGWVATSQAGRDAIIAIANGGKLTSISALASHGVWDGCDNRIHVALVPNSPRQRRKLRTPIAYFTPPAFPRSGIVRHWIPELAVDSREPPWRHSISDALRIAARHLALDQLVACIDSAIHTRVLSRAGLPQLESMLPARSRPALRLVDDRAESGLESLARVRLSKTVRRIQPQFSIHGIAATGGRGRVDLLLDGWLAIELDGDRWHDPKQDRLRDAELVRRGFRVHRFGFDQVVLDWPRTELTISELLRYPPPRQT